MKEGGESFRRSIRLRRLHFLEDGAFTEAFNLRLVLPDFIYSEVADPSDLAESCADGSCGFVLL